MEEVDQAVSVGLPQSVAAAQSYPSNPGPISHILHRPADDVEDRGHAARGAAAGYDSDEVESRGSFARQFAADNYKWGRVKGEYKRAVLQEVIDQHGNADGSRATIDQLKEFGITVYLAEHDGVNMWLLRQVVRHVTASRSDRSRPQYENQRCLLYRDAHGRLFNLTLDDGSGGLAGEWRRLMATHSGLQAVTALALLARAYACTNVPGSALGPGYMALVLGLVLRDETAHAWLNVSMFVRGAPSVAAHALASRTCSDWPAKSAMLLLAIASAMEAGTDARRKVALAGVSLAAVLLAANLGSRAWYFMRWRPVKSGGAALQSLLEPAASLLAATAAGIIFPYLGFRRIQSGGKAAVELVVANCLIVSALFAASDFSPLRNALVPGSDGCPQDGVNITVGIWLAISATASALAAKGTTPPGPHPEDDDPMLVEEQRSPVGHVVPNFPDLPLDSARLGEDGLPLLSERTAATLGLLACLGAGAFVVSMGFVDYGG